MDQQPRPHDGGRSADPIHKQGEIVSDKYKQSKDNSTVSTVIWCNFKKICLLFDTFR